MKYTFTPFPGAVAPAVLAAMAKPYGAEADELVRFNELRIQEIFFPDAAGLSQPGRGMACSVLRILPVGIRGQYVLT